MLITPFDPWKSKLCTCPEKLTFNPYTGCSYRCIYCYVSSYVSDFFVCRPKKNLISILEKEASKLEGKLISIANSSDPYPLQEEALNLTRSCLRVLSEHDCKLQIITKSNLVTRDIDLLKKIPSTVSMTITTDDDEMAKLLEPQVPPPSKRLKALEELAKNGIPVSARIDPIIPRLNDHPNRLIKKLSSLGALHVTCSTYKAKFDNWKRFVQTFPQLATSLQSLYFEKGEQIGRSFYLPRKMRRNIIEKVKRLVEREGMIFSSCREGFPRLNSATCDGSGLIMRSLP
ncbi:MAG: radical SAM protein [Candidatus Bathyarchaeia archaeon]